MQGQSGRAGKHAIASMRRRHPQPPSQEPGSTSRKGPTSTRPSNKQKLSFGRCFRSRSPASPGVDVHPF